MPLLPVDAEGGTDRADALALPVLRTDVYGDSSPVSTGRWDQHRPGAGVRPVAHRDYLTSTAQ